MRLDLSQQMRMLQQMRLAPRMIQSMEILQLPIMALEERIRQEAEENITLELGASRTETTTTDLEAEAAPESTAAQDSRSTEQEIAAVEQYLEEGSDNYFPGRSASRAANTEASDKKHEAIQNVADRPASLEDHLIEQLVFFDDEAEVLDFARYLIENLDSRGFLTEPLESLRWSFGRSLSEEQASRGLAIVQELEPPGVGARDMRECLLLQLQDPDPSIRHVEVLRTLIADHLDDLEHNRLPAISKRTGFSLATLHEAIEELKHLDLNPGAEFAPARTEYVVPDVTVEQGADGQFVIQLNDDHTPRVSVSRHYLRMLQESRDDPQVLEYVKRKINAARWLIDSIEQRRNTLQKVTRAIIEHQRAFLEQGPDHIEPLKMQQIADRVGVHVTTVSRAVDDKWIQTPRGIFPLKRFFGGGTVTSDGDEVAWDTIKRKLTEIIESEDKSDPYSDEYLVNKLAELGYPLARRTVTKYRKSLGIPSSRQRKVHR